jgi:hypothetical protein
LLLKEKGMQRIKADKWCRGARVAVHCIAEKVTTVDSGGEDGKKVHPTRESAPPVLPSTTEKVTRITTRPYRRILHQLTLFIPTVLQMLKT